jgi:hypothetical protein
MITVWTVTSIVFLLCFLDANLLLLHLYLNYKGISTYEMIMIRRK